ncbi:nucleotidyltransferase family protein [Rhizobium leguminosarum]|uniref:nucleotidyltransferase family protein n=1 Tax=Rhizobium leguminosarum TaxID=384 RepID=UPI003F958D45
MIDPVLRVAIVLLAAGRASRMGDNGHKLLAEFDGISLVRRSALGALASAATSVVVVTGYRAEEIENALAGLPVTLVRNSNFDIGIASSIITGFTEPGVQAAAGAVVMLADMPNISTAHVDILIERFQRQPECVVRSTSGGQSGNPVVLPKSLFDRIGNLTGDTGAKELIRQSGVTVVDIEIGDAAHADVDTAEAVIALGGRLTV